LYLQLRFVTLPSKEYDDDDVFKVSAYSFLTQYRLCMWKVLDPP